ncbi:hypothetical protein O181_030243 [Austropuccinia psidii MF-1]|uniref:Uncharacterized protein n=1 Tax=Austropuccinia psidii MF-1 TaxID=1389203 RepID=A0A9Q3CXD3_9BASI|nr:hypothetical protein [Austropuccinia psidii MF-1]
MENNQLYFQFKYCSLYHLEENYIPLETQSKANTPVTPSEQEGSKGKGKRHSEGLIGAKKWTPIAIQRSRKPRKSASIQVKPMLTACTGRITIINPVVTSKETLASKGTNHRTEKACPEPEDEEDTLDTVVDRKTLREIIPTLPFTFQFNRNVKPEDWKDMDQVIQLHQLLKDLFQWSMDNKRFNLASHLAELGARCHKICIKELNFKDLMIINKGWNPTRKFLQAHKDQAKSALQWLHTIHKPKGQWPRVTILHNPRRVPGEDKDTRAKTRPLFPKEERVRPSDPETVVLGERSTQEPEVVVNNSRINSPLNRNITPTQIEHNSVSPESNLNSDALWFEISQYAKKTQKQFAELEASPERMKKLTASMDKILKTLQEGHAQLRKASEETNKGLNIVFEEQHHSRRDRDCLDQEVNKLSNVYNNMKPQPQGHVMDNPYYQDDIKPDFMLVNKTRSPY